MPEEKVKKFKVFKVAKELNVSHTTIAEFLNKKGFKGAFAPNDSLSEEQTSELYVQFQKDKASKEQHEKKLSELRAPARSAASAPTAEPVATDAPPVRTTPTFVPAGNFTRYGADRDDAVETPEPQSETTLAEPVPTTEADVTPVAEAPVSAPVEPEAVLEPVAVETPAAPVAEAEPVVESTPVVAEQPAAPRSSVPVTPPRAPEPIAEVPAVVEPTLEATPAPAAPAAPEPTTAVADATPTPTVAETVPTDESTPQVIEAGELPSTAAAAEGTEGDDGVHGVQNPEASYSQQVRPGFDQKRPQVGLKVMGKIDLGSLESDRRGKRKRKGDPEPGKAGTPGRTTTDTSNVGRNATASASSDQVTTGGSAAARSAAEKKVKKKGVSQAAPKTIESESDRGPARPGDRKKKRGRGKGGPVDAVDVAAAIAATMASMDDSTLSGRARARRNRRIARIEAAEGAEAERLAFENTTLQVTEFMSAGAMAQQMGVNVSEVLQKALALGTFVSINQRLDRDTITFLADEFGFEAIFGEGDAAADIADEPDDPALLVPRPPVVTIMGHVDHGKTSLLDYIRSANVVAGEAGGITQHIGAYEVTRPDGRQITFLDTPGHEAFTAMRARGAQATDLVILVVAADDAVMPQTVEAINHAQAASVPMVIAINKIDKPNANGEKIRQQLAERNVLVEDWGGKYQVAEVSAKQGLNVDQLLEKVLLESDLLELKANPDRDARGVVVETELDRERGAVATVLVQNGTLKVGDPFVAGTASGRVRAMVDERGHRVELAGPSTPVQVLGFDVTPQAGDRFVVMPSEREARDVSRRRQQIRRDQEARQVRHLTLDDLSKQAARGGAVRELNLIVKGDVDGSVEALADSMAKLSTEEVAVRVIHKGVGAITESDILLASASDAIVIGFQVRPNVAARRLAETESIDVRFYSIIYDAISEVKSALEGLLAPEVKEEILGTIEVRETFKVPKIGTVAGCYVTSGRFTRNTKVRLLRDGIVLFNGGISSLKRFKEDVREVETGYECGLSLNNFNDIQQGDTIEGFRVTETARKLA